MEALIALGINLFSSAAWEVIRDPIFGATHRKASQRNLEKAATAATARLAPILSQVAPSSQESVESFLRSTEVHHLVGQLYRSRMTAPGESLVALRQTFAATWAVHNPDDIRALSAYDLFDALVAGCEDILTSAITTGNLSAHEAMSTVRHKQLQERLTSIERQLPLLAGPAELDLETVDHAEAELRQRVANAHSHIAPPNLRGEKDIPVDDIFVTPTFIDDQGGRLSFSDVVNYSQRLVVRGAPGAGKSTFARKLCRDRALRRAPLGDNVSPPSIFIELRAYVRAIESMPASIRDYLASFIASSYQLVTSAETIEYLLSSGRLGVTFDGLDELPVISQRRQVRDAVEAFASAYPLAPVVVTTRQVGYEHASLASDLFTHVRLAEFDEDQISDYANRWFAIDSRHGADHHANTVEAFLSESKSAPELRANPLMLGLMCVLYRGQSYIPRNRPELYRQCATYLFETWDRHRGIEANRPFERLLRPAMRELAFWIYTTPGLQRGVSHSAAVDKTTRFLVSLQYADRITSEEAALSFIEFCRGRAWVFSDVGGDAADQDLFAFTHRTFLEFFAAEQILDQSETTAQLIKVLKPHVYAGEWDVVAQLAVHIQEERHIRSADRCLNELLDHANSVTEFRHVLEFAVRLLTGVIPTSGTIHRVADAVLDSVSDEYFRMADDKQDESDDASPASAPVPFELFIGLLQCDPEARRAVSSSIERRIVFLLNQDDPALVAFGCDLAVFAPSLAETGLLLAISEQRDWWLARLDTVANGAREMMLNYAKGTERIAILMCAAGWLSATDLVKRHGTQALFRRPVTPFDVSLLPCVAQRLLRGENLKGSKQLDRLVCEEPLPWLARSRLSFMLSHWGDFSRVSNVKTPSAARILVLCAAVEPSLDGPMHPSTWPGTALLNSERRGPMSDLDGDTRVLTLEERVIDARNHRGDMRNLGDELREAGYLPQCIEILDRWIQSEVSLLVDD